MVDDNIFLEFPAFPFFSLKNGLVNALLGITVVLTTSSCIPVRPQPLRARAEQRRSPPCIYTILVSNFIFK